MADEKEIKEIIEQVSPMIMEQCMQSIMEMALSVAKSIPDGVGGREALEIFVRSMEGANNQIWPKGEVKN